MRRRNFLSLLGMAGGAAAAGVAIAAPKAPPEDRGIYVSLSCNTGRVYRGWKEEICPAGWSIFVDLTGPIILGSPQCPRCLNTMQWPEDTAQRIKAWHLARGNETSIYTPRNA